jgi:cellulose biosynthesis protein BcsQ
VNTNIGIVAGDLALARAEDDLSNQWPLCLNENPRAFRVSSAFYRLMDDAAKQRNAELVLIDVGPNLGAINRAAVIAADYIAVPMAPDLFSLQGLRNLGPTLRRWRTDWQDRLSRAPVLNAHLPGGAIAPIGYIASQHVVRQDRPTIAYNRWMQRIPNEYRRSILNESGDTEITVDSDPYRLAQLKHYRSLMPMSMEAHKPMFLLKPADGAIGAHVQAVQNCHTDFKQLAITIAERCGIEIPAKSGLEQIALF